MEQMGLHWMDFGEINVEDCSKICWENSSLIEISQAKWVLYMKTDVNLCKYLS